MNSKDSLTLLIVPYNRPERLEAAFNFYYARFAYLDPKIIILDSSRSEFAICNKDICGKFQSKLNINYKYFENDISLYEKLLIGAKSSDSEVILMSSDDDYMLLDQAQTSVKFLEENPDYSFSTGTICKVFVDGEKNNQIYFRKLASNESENIHDRIALQTQGMTTYVWGVYRRSILIKSLSLAVQMERVRHDQFSEYVWFFATVIFGKTKIFDRAQYVMMRHKKAATHTLQEEFPASLRKNHFDEQITKLRTELVFLLVNVQEKNNSQNIESSLNLIADFLENGYQGHRLSGKFEIDFLDCCRAVLFRLGCSPMKNLEVRPYKGAGIAFGTSGFKKSLDVIIQMSKTLN